MYDLSIFIGRFQPFHNGHLFNIQTALQNSKKILINIGSSYTSPNIKNPLSFEQRKQMILEDLKISRIDLNRIIIEPLRDHFYEEERWKDELKTNVKKHSSNEDKIAIVGHIKDDSSYYIKSFPNWGYIPVGNYKNYNATDFREIFYKEAILKEYMVSRSDKEGSYKFLKAFIQTPEFENLKNEYHANEEYKESWRNSPYAPMFVTTDSMIVIDNKVLLIQKKNKPGKGLWALPGGFLKKDEFIETSVIRELYEETQIDISLEELKSSRKGTFVFDYPSRSPRGRTVTHVSLFILDKSNLPKVLGSDDAKDTKWFDLNYILDNMTDKLFEDHYQIIDILSRKY